jgi:hypothetical protein
MDAKALDRGEAIAALGGLVLLLSLFLDWYSLGDKYASINGCHGPNAGCTGWSALTILRFFLILVAVAPGVLAWVIIRGHALSWPRGELTAVFALSGLTFIIFRGLVDKPGSPSGQITIDFGWFIALLGGLLILAGSIFRARESATRRKPPGIL